MAEIEPSSRLYEQNGALYMTVERARTASRTGSRRTTPIGFVLTDNRLVTIRYATPKPVRAFSDHARREPELVRDAPTVLVRLPDAIIDRLADELESVGAEIEHISSQIFQKEWTIGGSRPTRLTRAADPDRPSANPADQDPLHGRQHDPDAELPRRLEPPERTRRAGRSAPRRQPDDRRHLAERACELPGGQSHLLLDASLGLISIEQNAAMKLFSWAAVVFLPPTLIAGIFGMNFHYMPELNWRYGYPTSLALMLVCAVGPYSI